MLSFLRSTHPKPNALSSPFRQLRGYKSFHLYECNVTPFKFSQSMDLFWHIHSPITNENKNKKLTSMSQQTSQHGNIPQL